MSDAFDYDYLLKLDNWSKKEAALIVCGLDPEAYRGVRLTDKEIPKELAQAQKVYRIFLSVNFFQKYGSPVGYPLHYVFECGEKVIALPEALKQAIKARTEKIRKNTVSNDNEKNEGIRERHNLLKIISVLSTVYAHRKEKPSPSPKKVVSHIVEDILQYLEDHDLRVSGLGKSNLHKKISEGLDILNEEEG